MPEPSLWSRAGGYCWGLMSTSWEVHQLAYLPAFLTCYTFLPINLLSCRYADTWLAWVTMERSLRQIPAARSLFKRCFNRKMDADGQLSVAMQWLRFEREEGRWGPAPQGHAVLCCNHTAVLG